MSRHRDDREDNRSRRTHRGNRGYEDSSIDSGYGGSAAASSKLSREDALRESRAESTGHHAKSSRRESTSPDYHGRDVNDSGHNKHKLSDSDTDYDTDYDPRDKYYLDVNDDERDDISFRNNDISRDGHASEDANSRKRRERGTPAASRRSNSDGHRHGSSSSRHRGPDSSSGSDHGDSRKRRSSRDSDISGTRGRRGSASSRQPRSKASVASHSRHESDYRSLSPIPSDSWGDSDRDDTPARPRRAASSRREPRGSKSGKLKRKGHDDATGWLDPKGETPQSFLQKLTKGIDIKSVGRVGLDAAAVAAVKVAVGTRVPWKQRIPKTIAAGAAAAIMDFAVKKTSFQPKGMVGTMFARQFVEIILANLIVNPVSNKLTGVVQGLPKGGKTALKGSGGGVGRDIGGGGRRRR